MKCKRCKKDMEIGTIKTEKNFQGQKTQAIMVCKNCLVFEIKELKQIDNEEKKSFL